MQPEQIDLSKDSCRVFNIVNLVQVLCSRFRGSHSCLQSFCYASLSVRHSCAIEEGPSSSIWPVPPPRWRWTGSMRLSPKRRKRRAYFKARHDLLSLIVCVLNWQLLGFPKSPPTIAVQGYPLSVQQHEVLERLELMLDHFLHAESFQASDLGRVQTKFEVLISQMKELPSCLAASGLEDLTELAENVAGHLDPYKTKCSVFQQGHDDHQCQFEPPPSTGAASASVPAFANAKPVEAARVKWESTPSFNAVDFLPDPLVKAAFEDPETLRKPREMWPPPMPAKMHISKEEFLVLARKWDDLNACLLLPASDKDLTEAVGIFCVDKDNKHDRLIINPRTINSRMFTISQATKDLAPGCLLGLLSLRHHECFRFSADDLTDYYYTFLVSAARAKRNAFKMKFHPSELRHFKSFYPGLEAHSEILVCLRTLAMGDSLAVEIAQMAHTAVLKQLCAAMLPHQVLKYRSPIPRSDFVELLAIDDHVGIQRLPIQSHSKNPSLRDTEVFQASEVAYKAVGLVQHEKKRKRNLTQGIILGADFDGMAGRVMAPRARIILLSIITMAVAVKGTCTPKLLSVLTGCWVHVLMFRRVLFSVMSAVFHEGQGLPPNQPFCLSRQARCEMQMLSLLSPLAQSDLRTHFSSKVFIMDASPYGGAVCSASVGETASRELWRHTEQRGCYTKLQSPVSEILSEKGLEPETMQIHVAPSQEASFVHPSESFSFNIPSILSEGVLYDCVEVFRGSGNWSHAHVQRGLAVHDGFDIDGRRIRFSDMSSKAVFAELVALALRRVVLDWHFGTPCVSFGTLRRPQVRSKEYPAGFDSTEPFTALHNSLARRTAFIMTIAFLLGQFVSAEQPGSSRMFLLHCFKVLVQLGCVISHFAFCRFGSGFHKPSKWLHNKPWLVPLEGGCNCPYRGSHFVVHGNFTAESIKDFCGRCRPSCLAVYGKTPNPGDRVSSFSGAYPFRLVHQMASGLIAAQNGAIKNIPAEKRLASFQEVGIQGVEAAIAISPEPSFRPRQWFEDPEWITELCDSLPFKEMYRFRFKKAGHININEARTYKSWIKSQAKSEPNSRFVGILDSRVTLGAAAKGRSSSPALSRILQGCLPYILGSNLYPGGLHCSSGANRADGPSRDRDMSPPVKDEPEWFSRLKAGDPSRFDIVVSASRYEKNPARWLRFLLLLCGDIEPHPGPSKRVCQPRGPLKLDAGFHEATASRMESCLHAFQTWMVEVANVDPETIFGDGQAIATALRAYGMFLFEAGFPRYQLVYAVTASQDRFPICKPWCHLAWQIDRKWQNFEPGQSRSVLPPVAIRAMACVGSLWGWTTFVAVLLLGFAAMLHPSEMLALKRRDLLFPRDLSYDTNSLYIYVRNPKTARFARRQHGRIDDWQIIAVAESAFNSLPLESPLYSGSMHSFRRQWNAIMQKLHIPHSQVVNGATPGVLRGSGATFLYAATEDPQWIAWRGRWSRLKTLEFYLQEVGATVFVHSLDPHSRALIEFFSEFSWPVLCRSFSLQGSTVGMES